MTQVKLPRLGYKADALEPYISEKTIEFHYGKHHQGYVDKTNKIIAGSPYADLPLEEIVKSTRGKSENLALFNNAAQVYNHTFYWNSMKPAGGGAPGGRIAQEIERNFGGYPKFSEAFSTASVTLFGSGWVWLVQDGDALKIIQTANADTPIADGLNPLLTIDVWEHAYYLDYQNQRGAYVKSFLEHLVNWDFAESNLNQKT
jgi:Fe-Mn family superoxide dismutase